MITSGWLVQSTMSYIEDTKTQNLMPFIEPKTKKKHVKGFCN